MAYNTMKYVLVVTTLAFLLIFYLYSLSQYDVQLLPRQTPSPIRNTTTIGAMLKDRFFVRRYNFDDDKLKLEGYFEQTSGENLYQSISIEGISNLINQLKPLIVKDGKFQRPELKHEHYFKTDNRQVKSVSCKDIFQGDAAEIDRAIEITNTQIQTILQPDEYVNMTKNCSKFIKTRGYITDPLTEYERDFPIAFSLLMYKDVEQTERLLRAIYRPQNIYCVHVDNKSSPEVFKAMKGIVDCFENVFMASKKFDVKWGTMTVLEPELQCMEELWNKNKTWKYFINLTGQEFPLRTNYELVRILEAYNGANDIDGTIQRANKDRWAEAGPPPHGITPVKGSVHITATRGYVDFLLHDQKAKDFLNWTRNTKVPDETYFATLNNNPQLGVPGAYKGLPETDNKVKHFVTRFKNWGDGVFNWPCHGKRVRMLCIFATADLPLLGTRKELFFNKMYSDYHPFVQGCMEELLFNHTRDEYTGELAFDSRWYASLSFVNNHV